MQPERVIQIFFICLHRVHGLSPAWKCNSHVLGWYKTDSRVLFSDSNFVGRWFDENFVGIGQILHSLTIIIRFFYRKPLKSHTSPEIFGNSVHRWKTWNHRPRNVFLVEKIIKNLFLWYLDNSWGGAKFLIFSPCSGISNCSSKTSENAWIFMKKNAFWWISLSELYEGKSQQPTRLPQ